MSDHFSTGLKAILSEVVYVAERITLELWQQLSPDSSPHPRCSYLYLNSCSDLVYLFYVGSLVLIYILGVYFPLGNPSFYI